MTRPKYERQRDKALKHLNDAMKVAHAKGKIIFQIPRTDKQLEISFKTKEGNLDNKFYSQFFSATYALLKMEYNAARDDKWDRKAQKVVKENPAIVMLNSMVVVYTKWDRISDAINNEQNKLRTEQTVPTV